MSIPSYFLPRPTLTLDAAERDACHALLAESMAHPGGDLTARLPVAPWRFFCYLADVYPLLLHGSQNPAIAEFAPRSPSDVNSFSNQTAVYAASDGIWPMFFAILDRERYQHTLINGSFRELHPDGQHSDPYYFFSLEAAALAEQPWRTGTVYLLPRTTFEQHPPIITADNRMIEVMEWASLQAVRPYGYVTITPADFPFLNQVCGHNEALFSARAAANPDGWPWVDEQY